MQFDAYPHFIRHGIRNAVRNVATRASLTIMTAALGLMSGTADPAESRPLKVFILAGQSNMEGHARIETLDYIGEDPATAPLLKEMRGPDGKPVVCKRAWISYLGRTGNLTAGYGASGSEIGPEFTFGLYIQKTFNEPVLLIKTAWGGKDLHTDFRPPSAGAYEWGAFELTQRKNRGDNLETAKAEKIKATGVSYRMMIDHVRTVLGDIKRVVPEYDPRLGYELAGFVWFQGFNDLVSTWTYPNGYDLYGQLLVSFIRDVRKDLSAPRMPFVIGVMGIGGEQPDASQGSLRKAQQLPTTLPEFKGNVIAVQTGPFWDKRLGELEEKKNRSPEEEALWKRGASNGGYHYLGCGKTFALIGKAFAEANRKLILESVTALTGPGPYVKLAPLAKQIQQGQGLGAALKTLADKRSSSDPAEAQEATAMYDALSTGAQIMLDDGLRDKEPDPVSAIAKLDLVARKFSGSDYAAQAKQESEELKKDPKVRKEIQANAKLERILALEPTLKPVPSSPDPRSEGFRRQNLATLQAIVGGCQDLLKNNPDTAAARRASAVLDKYR
jgi:hypothetical protein